MSLRLAHWIIANTVGIILLTVASFKGLIGPLVFGDPTYLTPTIMALALVAVALVPKRPDWAGWLADQLVQLGLIGTVIGFIMAIGALDPAAIMDSAKAAPMIAGMMAGMSTALYTTLVGSVGWLWTELLLKLTRSE